MTGRAPAVFFGSGPFAVPILEALAAAPEVDRLTVVTTPPRPAGRGGRTHATPVGERAMALGLPLLAPARLRDEAALAPILAAASQLVVLADYGRLLPAALVETPVHGALNLHPSLLPRWRGATPVAHAIAAGDDTTGVTLMRMDRGLDTGPLVDQVGLPIEPDETAPRLEARLAQLAATMLRARLGPWLRGELSARPQPTEGVTQAPAFARDDGRLDGTGTALAAARRVRALQPWPGTFIETPAGRLVLWQVRPIDGRPPGSVPGTVVALGAGLALVMGSDWLTLEEIQLAGG
ncbi:MAG: methionyl-tRNA formyltransferase, partial [Candidatus Limnocylindrales bacterium]